MPKKKNTSVVTDQPMIYYPSESLPPRIAKQTIACRTFLFFARYYMNTYGLQSWDIKLDRCCSRAGLCNFTHKYLSFSVYLAANKSIPLLKKINTILHEIAHALVGCEHGHNKVWQKKAIEIGSDGYEHHNMIFVHPTVIYQCPCRELTLYFFRATSKIRLCRECGQGAQRTATVLTKNCTKSTNQACN